MIRTARSKMKIAITKLLNSVILSGVLDKILVGLAKKLDHAATRLYETNKKMESI